MAIIMENESQKNESNSNESINENFESKMTPEQVFQLQLFDRLLTKVEPVLDYLIHSKKTVEAPIKKTTLWGFFIIVLGILSGSIFLVYFDKMDASNLALIIGIILGYLFSMAKNFIGANGNEN